MSEDMRELRQEIGKLHDKVDTVISNQNQQQLDTQLRLQALETAEANRLPFPERPCKSFRDHVASHESERLAAQARVEKWHERAWNLFVRFLPTLAGGIAGALAYLAAKWSTP
jgi:hypothetical protein